MLRKPCYGSHRPVAERLPVSRQVVASILAGGDRLGRGYAYRSSVRSPRSAYAERSKQQELAPSQSG
jgi:hypothetical protein